MSARKSRNKAAGPISNALHQRREAIKLAAKRLFASQGYMATTIRQIARAASMEGGSLYYHYRGKEEILLFMLSEGNRRLLDAAHRILAEATDDPVETLSRLIREHVRITANDHALFKISLELYRLKGQSRRRIIEQRSEYEHIIQDVINAAIRKKRFRPCNVKVVSFGLFGYLNSVAFWFSPSGPLTIEQIASQYVQSLLHGLLVSPPRT